MCSYRNLCLDSSLAQEILKASQAIRFGRDTVLFYEGHVPNVAIFLMKGEAVSFDKALSVILKGPVVIGGCEILSNRPSKSSLKVLKGANVAILDRPTLTMLLGARIGLQKFIAS